MNTALLLLFFSVWFSYCQMSSTHETPPPASLVVTPDRTQFYEYQNVSIHCQHSGPDSWMVWRHTETGSSTLVSPCGCGWGTQTSSKCTITTLKRACSGVYWCESKHRDSSNTINITVTSGPVILWAPVHPVTEGQDVTLRCQLKNNASETNVSFFRNGSPLNSKGQLILRKVSRSDEGAYSCEIKGHRSPTSWLLIKDVSKPVSLSVSPDSSQVFEYKSFSLSCSSNSMSQGWTIKRFPTNSSEVSSCSKVSSSEVFSCGQVSSSGQGWGNFSSSGCTLQTAKKSDSALYWCESPSKQRSNTIQITVYVKPVILQSPALPVQPGDRVTLSCLAKFTSDNDIDTAADFYKNGFLVRNEPTGRMTLHPVSTSDEGLYHCSRRGGESPSSWLFVRAATASDASSLPLAAKLWKVLYVPILFSFIYPTYKMIYLVTRRPAGEGPPGPVRTPGPTQEAAEEEGGADYDDAMAPVTTEHHF